MLMSRNDDLDCKPVWHVKMELADKPGWPYVVRSYSYHENKTEYQYCHTLSKHTVSYLSQWL